MRRRRWPARALSLVVTAALVAQSLVAAPARPAVAAAAVVKPEPPEPLTVPDDPVVAAQSVGYLPWSSEVKPSGNYTMSLPLDVPAGRAGVRPELSLEYSSNGTDGLFGVGWSLPALSAITRCGQTLATEGFVSGVHLDIWDRFCVNGTKLVPLDGGANGGEGTEYRTETDVFTRFVSQDSTAAGPGKFVAYLKNGRIREYTAVTAPRWISVVDHDPATPATPPSQRTLAAGTPRVMWTLTTERDRAGNTMTYEYQNLGGAEGLQIVPHRIRYTSNGQQQAHRYVEFEVEDHPHVQVNWKSGVRFVLAKRVASIAMYAPNPAATALVWKYDLDYETSGRTGRSLLASARKCAAAGGCAWAKKFGWDQSSPAPAFTATALGQIDLDTSAEHIASQAPWLQVLDVNGDGLDDLVYFRGGPTGQERTFARLGTRDAGGAPQPLSTLIPQNKVHDTDGTPMTTGAVAVSRGRPVDVDGDGVSEWWVPHAGTYELLRWDAAAQAFRRTGVSGNACTTLIAAQGLFCPPTEWVDFDGDGRLDLAQGAYTSHYVEPLQTPELHMNWGEYQVRHNAGGMALGDPVPTGVKAGCAARAGDVDGDGRGELLVTERTYSADPDAQRGFCADDQGWPKGHVLGRGSGKQLQATPSTFLGEAGTYRSAAGWQHPQGDFNGDGLIDVLGSRGNNTHQALWNTGNGLELAAGTVDLGSCPHTCRTADVNLDGRDDLVSSTGLWLSQGDGTFTEHPLNFGTPYRNTFGTTMTRIGDFNGDGHPDIVTVTEDGTMKLLRQNPHATDRVVKVFDEHTAWPRESVTYSPEWSDTPAGKAGHTCAYPLRCIRRGLMVVRSVTSRAHLVNPSHPGELGRTVHYSYEDPVTHVRGRGFLGFGEFRVWDPARPSQTVTTFDHRTSLGNGRYHPYAGIAKTVTTAAPILTPEQAVTAPGSVTARVTRTVATQTELRLLNGGKSHAVFPRKSRTTEWEQPVTLTWGSFPAQDTVRLHVGGISEPASPPRRVDTESDFDDFGSPTLRVTKTAGGVTRTVVSTYENRTWNWLVGLPQTRTETAAEADPAVPPVTRRTGFIHDDLGRPHQVALEKDNPDLDQRLTTTQWYDGLGVPVLDVAAAAGLPSRVTHTEYDPVYPGAPDERIHPSQTWSEHPDPVSVATEWTVVHPALGLPVLTMDANGVTTSATYDGLGRLRTTAGDGQVPGSVSYTGRADEFGGYNGIHIATSSGPQQAVLTSDARGLALRTATPGLDGQPIAVEAVYDALGRLVRQSRPATGAPAAHTKYIYDSLDRLVRGELPGGAVTTSTYTMSEQRSVDAGGDEGVVTFDADGRVVRSVNVLAVPGQPKQDIGTTYTYAPFDLPRTVTDPKGAQTVMAYDARGRRTSLNHPDQGWTSYKYNGFGETRREVAGGLVRGYTYDQLGRPATVQQADGTTVFTWDTSPHGRGMLAQATGFDGVTTAYRYDTAGRPAGLDLVDGQQGTYSLDMTYDANGRLHTLAYPEVPGRDRFTVQYAYNPLGYLKSVTDVSGQQPAGTLWQVTGRDADMALTDGVLGGSVALHHERDPATGRLTGVTAAKGTTTLLDIGYGHWPSGLVKSRTTDDGALEREETFAYDTLRRLTRWTVDPGSGPVTDYRYDTIGNLTDIHRDGAPVEHRTYGLPDGTQPRTLTRVTALPSHTHTGLGYDGYGRLTTRPAQSVTYTPFDDLPKTVQAGSQTWNFAYDAFGRRVRKSGVHGSTLYVPGYYEKRTTGGTVEHVFHVRGVEGAAADVVHRQPAGGGSGTTEVLYSLHDALGSVTQVLDGDGDPQSRHYYEPFGQRVNPDGSVFTGTAGTVTRGFTGHEHDDALKLINMDGRVYDPSLRRFLTPDPIVGAPGNGQSWNPYSYVGNSPLTFTDPSGYYPCFASGYLAECTDVGCDASGGGDGCATWVDYDNATFWTDQVADWITGGGGAPWGSGTDPGGLAYSDESGAGPGGAAPAQCRVGCHFGNSGHSGPTWRGVTGQTYPGATRGGDGGPGPALGAAVALGPRLLGRPVPAPGVAGLLLMAALLVVTAVATTAADEEAQTLQRYYHYGPQEAIDSIVASGVIMPGWPGAAVYVTDLAPDAMDKESLTKTLFGTPVGDAGPRYDKVQAYVEIWLNRGEVTPTALPYVYSSWTPLYVKGRIGRFGPAFP
ncbi:FG-GAP-like repeat-containing protein [Sphaerisporangium sp. B11E5]|uniref:RHS repeat-associated core domain-containing protein n=1 Tax=Sphaerisporangium sp. B11E5 TaxID=3153563 RepID=UPI00325E078D